MWGLPRCIGAIEGALTELTQSVLPAQGCSRYVLFGRSSGAYLALLLTKRMQQAAQGALSTPVAPASEYQGTGGAPAASGKPKAPGAPSVGALATPAALWCFYGYHDLAAPFISQPCKRYATLPNVDAATVSRIAGEAGNLVTSGPKNLRFGLYIHARQHGTWNTLLGLDAGELGNWSLSDDNVAQLPPTFFAASTGDADVPFSASKHMARTAPGSRMFQAYDLEHDFDRDVANPAGAKAYDAALAFLEQALLC